MNKISKILMFPLIASAMLFTSCMNKDDEPQIVYYSAFSTLENLAGTQCTFSVMTAPDGPSVNFYTTITNAADFEENGLLIEGNRYVIMYNTPDNGEFTPGNISLVALGQVYQNPVDTAAIADIKPLFASDINTVYYSRTGKYLNLTAQAQISTDKVSLFGLYVDEETLDSEWPMLYLCFKRPEGDYSLNYVNLYGSYDISKYLNAATAKGVKLNVYIQGKPQVIEIPNGRQQLQPID